MSESRRRAASTFAPVSESLAAEARGAAHGPAEAGSGPRSLNILHVLRAPVGGLFRHVVDVAQGQAARGHRVGVIADSLTGGERAEAVLGELAPNLALGVERVAIARQIGWRDVHALQFIARRIATLQPDVIHGHGAKGAALSRLAPRSDDAIRVYTPHGGSLNYAADSLAGRFYHTLERLLNRRTDLFLFESKYAAREFRTKVGAPRALVRVVHNGVGKDDFAPVAAQADATDLVCVGELRMLKGIDLLIEALAMFKQSGRPVRATVAGSGPDEAQLKALAERLGIGDRIRFVGHRPAREAFALGHILVVPSRIESLPYVVLEAAAAGMPIVATRAGGIPEIFGARASDLVAPGNARALLRALTEALDDPAGLRRAASAVNARVRGEFTIDAMVDHGLAAYREALAMRKIAQFA
jgi:glycosyltransferase involved in cell wall biosynthesis